jgi:hypothetical protein
MHDEVGGQRLVGGAAAKAARPGDESTLLARPEDCGFLPDQNLVVSLPGLED